jgi:phosphoribosylamine--glycine ligase
MLSRYGEGLNLLYQISCEGNETEFYLSEGGKNDLWKGLLQRVDVLPLEKDAIYIFDMSGNGRTADNLINRNYNIVCGSSFADKIEFDRNEGLELMKAVGINTPKSYEFKDCNEAKKFFDEHKNERFVFKPSGKNLPCSLSHVPQEGEDISRYVEYVGKVYGKEIKSIEVQEFVDGVAVSTEGWFDGYHFIRPFNHTIEKKKFLNNDLGPATGCVGNSVWLCEEDGICTLLRKLEPYLQGKYCGPIDLNCIVNESGIYGLEWTPRFGYDSIPALIPMFNEDVGKFFSDLARNQFEGEMPLDDIYSSALRVVISPYPEDEKDIPSGLPLDGICEEDNKYYFYEIAEEDGKLIHSEGYGLILCTLAQNEDLQESLDDCLCVANELKIPNKMYRTDLTEIINKEFEEFKEVSYAGRSSK